MFQGTLPIQPTNLSGLHICIFWKPFWAHCWAFQVFYSHLQDHQIAEYCWAEREAEAAVPWRTGLLCWLFLEMWCSDPSELPCRGDPSWQQWLSPPTQWLHWRKAGEWRDSCFTWVGRTSSTASFLHGLGNIPFHIPRRSKSIYSDLLKPILVFLLTILLRHLRTITVKSSESIILLWWLSLSAATNPSKPHCSEHVEIMFRLPGSFSFAIHFQQQESLPQLSILNIKSN